MDVILLTTLQRSPPWIWPLLAGMIWYGLRASRQRDTSAIAVYCLPLLGLISLREIVPAGAPVIALWAAAWAMGAALGFRMQRRWLLAKAGRRVSLAGEWITFATLMTIFWTNYASAVLRSVAPDIHASLLWSIGFPVVIGLASGTLGGRALMVWRASSAAAADRAPLALGDT